MRPIVALTLFWKKAIGHADYDDRLTRALNGAFAGYNTDVRPALRQNLSTEPDHTSGDRLTPDALHALLAIDSAVLNQRPIRSQIVLFDDVLTSGKHFKCCVRRLRDVIPADVAIRGLFVARRILPNPFGVFSSPGTADD